MKIKKQHIDYSGYCPGPKTVEEAVNWYIEYDENYGFNVCGYRGKVFNDPVCDIKMYEECGYYNCYWCEEVLKKYCEECRGCLEEGKDNE